MAINFSHKKRLITIALIVAIAEIALVGYLKYQEKSALSREEGELTNLLINNSEGASFGTTTGLGLESKASLNLASNSEKLTATESASRDLFTKYLYLKETGKPIDAATQAELIESVLNKVQLTPIKQYTVSDIRVAPTETKESIKNYGNQLGLSADKNSPAQAENVLEILLMIAEYEDYTLIPRLEVQARGYDAIANGFLTIQVPKSAENLHVSLVNVLKKIAHDVRGATKLQSDPLYASVSAIEYNKDTELLAEILSKYKSYFASRGVTFERESAGYSFTHAAE